MTKPGEVEQTNVKVIARCRPFNAREIAAEGGVDNLRPIVVMEGGNIVRVLDPERGYAEREAFAFDHALWSVPPEQDPYAAAAAAVSGGGGSAAADGGAAATPAAAAPMEPPVFVTQRDVFELTGRPAVEAAIKGFNCTILAYGQTGSGKTFTMLGGEGEAQGVAPRLVRFLFQSIEDEQARHPEERVQFSVELSFLEIYNERVTDLLAIAAQGGRGAAEYTECRVRFHPERGTFVEGLSRLAIESEAQCLNAITGGMEHRATTSTAMNDTSSRSHAIFQVCVTQKAPLKGTTRVSIMNLVDLAGSERIKMSQVTGKGLTEAKAINLSLSTLRRVIDVLIDNSRLKKGQRPAVPPYRESLLTWILSDSLGGNSKTLMIVAVSPYAGNLEDTLSTLRYGLKAKAIVCNARVNEEKATAVVNALRSQVDDLRRQLEAKVGADQAEQERLEAELREREAEFERMLLESRRLDDATQGYEAELRQKAVELTRAQEQMAALERVEETKEQKEAELQRARELQAETAAMLRQQEEERMRKDAELAAVLQRKNSLKRHHDRAADEEARAKLAAEQARLRQFVGAFQNAFLLGKQRSGLEELKEEHAFLSDRVAKLQGDLAARESQLTAMVADKALLQRKVDLLEQRCESMQRELEEVIHAKNKRIDELARQRDEADAELSAVRARVAARREELAAMSREVEEEHDAASRRLEALHDRYAALSEEVAEKQRQLAVAKEALAAAQAKLDGLDETSAQCHDKLRALRAENERREAQLAELQRRKAALQHQREHARSLLEQRRGELADAQERLAAVRDEAAATKQSHFELRQYVEHKFFAVGDGGRVGRTAAAAAAAGGGGQLNGSAVTTPRRAAAAAAPAAVSTPRSQPRSNGGAPAVIVSGVGVSPGRRAGALLAPPSQRLTPRSAVAAAPRSASAGRSGALPVTMTTAGAPGGAARLGAAAMSPGVLPPSAPAPARHFDAKGGVWFDASPGARSRSPGHQNGNPLR